MLREELSREDTGRREGMAPGGSQPEEAATLAPGSASPSPAPSGTPSPSGSGPASSEPREPAFPVPGWDRYQPVRFLGQGGMGRVFLAYDPLLRRNVALKFVRGEDPELARRFLAEARAQARVRHERVCEVYEVGEVQGRGYIAMQLRGRAAAGTARGLAHAGAEGAAALARPPRACTPPTAPGSSTATSSPPTSWWSAREDGGLRPFVMDFGLARDWKEEGTAIGRGARHAPLHGARAGPGRGVPAGPARGRLQPWAPRSTRCSPASLPSPAPTPWRSSPASSPRSPVPRARWTRTSPRTSRPSSSSAWRRSARPATTRRARSPRTWSASSAASPCWRARAWATGCARRPASTACVLSLGSAALLVVLLALGQAVLARREVAERERLSRSFTERVERMEASARYSALSRLHDTREDREALRAEMAALEAEVRQAGAHAVGPGQYALGRALLALDDKEGARERLEAAWAHGYREPRVAWALALVLGHLYQEQLLLEVERRNPEQREARRRELEQRYRDPALAWLRQAEGPGVPAPPLYVKALLAFYEEPLRRGAGPPGRHGRHAALVPRGAAAPGRHPPGPGHAALEPGRRRGRPGGPRRGPPGLCRRHRHGRERCPPCTTPWRGWRPPRSSWSCMARATSSPTTSAAWRRSPARSPPRPTTPAPTWACRACTAGSPSIASRRAATAWSRCWRRPSPPRAPPGARPLGPRHAGPGRHL